VVRTQVVREGIHTLVEVLVVNMDLMEAVDRVTAVVAHMGFAALVEDLVEEHLAVVGTVEREGNHSPEVPKDLLGQVRGRNVGCLRVNRIARLPTLEGRSFVVGLLLAPCLEVTRMGRRVVPALAFVVGSVVLLAEP
jgi:hypothetical protein